MRKILAAIIVVAALMASCREHRHPAGAPPADFGKSRGRVSAKMRSVVYPYSVVAGGVDSRADIEDAMNRDAIVARHYSDINVPAVETVQLKRDTSAYVSFRKNGQIYWTAQKVYLAKGEQILSDGTNNVRARCGNRISWEPRGPVLPKESAEPTSAQFSTPVVRNQSIDDMPPVFQSLLANGPAANPIPTVASPATPVPGIAPPALAGGGGSSGGSPSAGGGFSPLGPYIGALPTSSGSPSNPSTPVTPVTPITPVSIPGLQVVGSLVPPLAVTIAGGPYSISPLPGAPATETIPVVTVIPGGSSVLTPPVTPISPPPPVPPPSNPSTPDNPSTPSTPTTPTTPTTPVTPTPPAPVPEPSAIALLGLGITVFAVARRRRTGLAVRPRR